MNPASDEAHRERSNPFATRFIRPGAVPYIFDEGQSLAMLVARLESSDWRAQIVGPHGSGKSTLLADLVAAFERTARRAAVFALHDGQRRMPSEWLSHARRLGAKMIVVDGYEQLGRLSRCRLMRRCRLEGWALLVTAHQDVGFQTLLVTKSTLATAQKVVSRLLTGSNTRLEPKAIADAFAGSNGNIRETLFALYDHFEQHAGSS